MEARWSNSRRLTGAAKDDLICEAAITLAVHHVSNALALSQEAQGFVVGEPWISVLPGFLS
eukprot:1141619-Pelagomonas_calceolata.AAC.5